MKTLETFFKLYTSCVNTSYSQSHSLRPSLSFGSLLKRIRPTLAHVSPVNRVSLLALRTSEGINARIFLGGLMLLVVAPLAGVAYQLFDKSSVYDWAYYVNPYYFFIVAGPVISQIVILTGIFFLFPLSKRTWFISIPMAYPVGRLLWMVTASSNDEFNQITPYLFIVIGLLLSIIWLFTFNWLVDRKFHKYDGICTSIEGVMQSQLPDKKKLELLDILFHRLRTFER